jgi:tetratricopeptide (TPR) repeat protein
MQAVLNGMTGAGLLIDGDRVSLLHVDGDPSTAPGRLSDLPYVMGEACDIDFMSVAGADEALAILRCNRLREEGLDLVLILLDSDLSGATRMEAAVVLNHMLLDWDLRTWLEAVLYGAPLPAGADVAGALRYARGVAEIVAAMLLRLSDLQPAIGRVHEAWNSVCARDLSLPAARNEATALAARNGVFRELVHALEGTSYDQFRFAALSALQPVPGHRRIVEELIRELHLPLKIRKPGEPVPAADDDHVPRMIRDGDRKSGEYLSFDRKAAFENVKRQKDAIVGHMRAGRFDLVEQYVNWLIEYQLPLDNRGATTSKSLCDLAMEAKSLSLFELQLELANRAVGLRYEDGWAWAQVGDASLILNRFDDALAAYRRASDLGADLIGRVGNARAFLAMGKLQESLVAFEQVIRDYPSEVVPKVGRAEVLKSMGRLDEALGAYNDLSSDFPTDVMAKAGRSEVLRSMGRLDEALEAYEDVIREYPADVVAKNGRADALRSVGRLDEALNAFEAVIREHPMDVIAKYGRAEVLNSMGRSHEALKAYEELILGNPLEVIAKIGRAEALKSLGNLDEALAAFEELNREYPTNVVAKNGRAELLKYMGRLDEALASYDLVVKEFPQYLPAQAGRSDVLKSMKRLDQSLAAYDSVVREFPSSILARAGRAEVLKSMGRLEEALEVYGDVIQDVLRSMRSLEDELAYDTAIHDSPPG